jgi:two-component system alkaline phosphatase synthesis response regulator PhoP
MKSKTILIADDEVQYVYPLRNALEKEGYTVVHAQSAAEALTKASSHPSVLIMDLMHSSGNTNGLDVCRELRAMPDAKQLPIIFVTRSEDEASELIGLELGADDYIRKPVSPRVLSARIKNVLKRYNILPASEVSYVKDGEVEVDRNQHTVKVRGKDLFLPRKEFEILWLLLANKGKVYSRDMLLRRIWGENVYVTERTVDVHICKIRDRFTKLGLDKLETIKGVGYRFKV